MKLNNQHSFKKKAKRKKIKKSRKTNLKRKNPILKKLLGGDSGGHYAQNPDVPYIIHIDFVLVDDIYSGEYIYKHKELLYGHTHTVYEKGEFELFWDKGAWVIVHENDKGIITSSTGDMSQMKNKGYRFTPIGNNNIFPSKNIGKWEIIKNGEWTDFNIVEPIIRYDDAASNIKYDSPSTEPFTFEINVTVNKKKQEQFKRIVLDELLKSNTTLGTEEEKTLMNERIFISFNDIQTGGGNDGEIDNATRAAEATGETVRFVRNRVTNGVKTARIAAATLAKQASEAAYKTGTKTAKQASEAAYKTGSEAATATIAAATLAKQASEAAYKTGTKTAKQASEAAYKTGSEAATATIAAATLAKQASETAGKSLKTSTTSSIYSAKRYVADKKKTVTAIIKIYQTEHLDHDTIKKSSKIIKDKLNDGKILERLKKLDIDIVGQFEDQFKTNSVSTSNSAPKPNSVSTSNPAPNSNSKKISAEINETEPHKHLIEMIRSFGEDNQQRNNDKFTNGKNDKFTNGKKSLSIVYKLEDILEPNHIDELIITYKNYKNINPDLSKYADVSGVSVVKLFKMPESTYEFTHVLVSSNFDKDEQPENFTTTLQLLMGEEASTPHGQSSDGVAVGGVVDAVGVGGVVDAVAVPATDYAPVAVPATATVGVPATVADMTSKNLPYWST